MYLVWLVPALLLMARTSCGAVTVDANLPAGNVVVEGISGDTVRLRQDLRDTSGEWFYWAFRVTGAAGRTLTFDFTNKKGGVWRSEDGKVYYPQWTIPGKGGAGMIWTCGAAKDMAVAFSSDGMTFLDVAGARVRPARAGKVYTLPISGSPTYFFGGEILSLQK